MFWLDVRCGLVGVSREIPQRERSWTLIWSSVTGENVRCNLRWRASSRENKNLRNLVVIKLPCDASYHKLSPLCTNTVCARAAWSQASCCVCASLHTVFLCLAAQLYANEGKTQMASNLGGAAVSQPVCVGWWAPTLSGIKKPEPLQWSVRVY